MKANKPLDETDVTPSKKKLKQARLPFKLISDISPKPKSPPTRKRKLSNSDTETVTKIGKISKENDVQELVIISDDESKDSKKMLSDDKIVNPYVKLVDVAWKKKQKLNSAKRKQIKKKNSTDLPKNDQNDTDEKSDEDKMNVDEPVDSPEKNVDMTILSNSTSRVTDNEIVILEDSSDQFDTKMKLEADIEPKANGRKSPRESKSNKIEQIEKSAEYQKSQKENPIKKRNEKDRESISSDELEEASGDRDKIAEKASAEIQKENNVTPKRSSRSATRIAQSNDAKKSPVSSLNESLSSDPTSPKHSRSSSVTNSQADESLNDSMSGRKNLTPKQLQKKLESAKKKEEREKEKQEREKKRQQEKDERARQKQEKEDMRKKEKEEKEEQRRKEKEEKEKQKELEKKIRDEKEEQKRKEKEEKEEQKRKEKEAKEEEKRKKQEALELEKQEQELKKKKTVEAFVNFFVPKQKSDKDQATVGSISKNNMLSSFTLKLDMRLAPTTRAELSDNKRHQLDNFIKEQKCKEHELYLKCLKDGNSKPLSTGKTWPLSDKDDDVMIIEDELPPIDAEDEIVTCDQAPREKLRPKLLSFHENRRPPYWGTWRKKTTFVKPRKPFGQDEKQLDYEVDSDEEWEEEQEGESIDGSAVGSDDEQDGDEYEVDNEVFVPHGYLSDEEATMEDDDVLSLSPETQKARLKHLEDEFETEMKKPTEKLKPRMYGPLWESSDGGKPSKCVDALWNYFSKLAMVIDDPTPFLQPSSEPDEQEKKRVKKKKPVNSENSEQNNKSEKKKKPKSEEKEGKSPKVENKKIGPEKKNQPGINMFLTKLKSS